MEVARVAAIGFVAVLFIPRAAGQFPQQHQGGDDAARRAEQELRNGIALTSRGQFQQAIPHFLVARGSVADSFALDFNLALCYVGTRQFPDAIRILTEIRERRPNVKNLLTQAYIGAHEPELAMRAFQEAVALSPNNERLYLQVSEACFEQAMYDFGAQVLTAGLRNLPDSARLHFERGVFYAQSDQNAHAIEEFQAAERLAPDSEVAYIAAAEEAFILGHVEDVIRAGRAGVAKGYDHYLLLTMLGEALLRAGAVPGAPEFDEARAVLEKAVAVQPEYSSSHVALGRIYLTLGHVQEAIAQLEAARRIDPRNKAAYPPLAAAYRQSGASEKAKEMLAALATLNREDAERIRSGEGGHAGYVGGKAAPVKQP